MLKYSNKEVSLLVAIQEGDLSYLETVMQQYPYVFGRFILDKAIFYSELNVIKLMLDKGIEASERDVYYAISLNDWTVVKLLLFNRGYTSQTLGLASEIYKFNLRDLEQV